VLILVYNYINTVLSTSIFPIKLFDELSLSPTEFPSPRPWATFKLWGLPDKADKLGKRTGN